MFLYKPSLLLLLLSTAHMTSARYVMYLTGQHPIVPSPSLVSDITHVALAFMRPSAFNVPDTAAAEWPLFTTIEKVRSQFTEGTKVMVAIGGWGDTEGFSEAASSEEGIRRFARNVKAMVEFTGADGVDIDWEYPGGNGEDYKKVPNSSKAWEIQAYPLLLSAIRTALGPHLLISAAVPGLPRDMLAFTPTTIPQISASLDFFNIMTYDLMNRRDNVTKHHTGLQASLAALAAYLAAGVPAAKANLGFAFYVKYFRTDHASCSSGSGGDGTHKHSPIIIGCRTTLMEDPLTGDDLGQTGGFAYHDAVPSSVAASWGRALAHGTYDDIGGGHYYLDNEEDLWWTWDTVEAIRWKVAAVAGEGGGERRRTDLVGGVFAWGLGEDAEEWVHLRALSEAWKKAGGGEKNVAAATGGKETATATDRGREEL